MIDPVGAVLAADQGVTSREYTTRMFTHDGAEVGRSPRIFVMPLASDSSAAGLLFSVTNGGLVASDDATLMQRSTAPNSTA